jgi:hypothetical protein
MSGQWQPFRQEGESDALQSLLEETYQKLNRGQEVHTHQCSACEQELVCVCKDRRQVDRATGKRRELYCLACLKVQQGLLAVEGFEVT